MGLKDTQCVTVECRTTNCFIIRDYKSLIINKRNNECLLHVTINTFVSEKGGHICWAAPDPKWKSQLFATIYQHNKHTVYGNSVYSETCQLRSL